MAAAAGQPDPSAAGGLRLWKGHNRGQLYLWRAGCPGPHPDAGGWKGGGVFPAGGVHLPHRGAERIPLHQ